MSVRVKLWGARGMEMGSNVCDSKRQTIRGSGLFQVPWVASGS